MDVLPYLRQWMKHYLQHKDMIRKSILDMKDDPAGLLLTTKDGEKKIVIQPILKDVKPLVVEAAKKPITVVVCNCKENLDSFRKQWDSLAAVHQIEFMFVNPLSKTEKKWIIRPFIHNRIADTASLQLGLQSLFDTVDPLTSQDVEKGFPDEV